MSYSKTKTPVIRPAKFVGISYPESAHEIARMFDHELERYLLQSTMDSSGVIIAPHIDFRVGLASYAPVYAALSRLKEVERVIILATSHYAAEPLFIPTTMHFSTPFGTLHSDTEFLSELYYRIQFPSSMYDWAHYEEHSIEFEVLWLQHIFQSRDIHIVPILITSFWPYILRGHEPMEDEYFTTMINALQELVGQENKKTAWVVSGDLAHVGRRFDDTFDAAEVLHTVRQEDAMLLERITRGDGAGFFNLVAGVMDCRKICGLAPIYTMLQTVRPQRQGSVADYQIWHDYHSGSAVSFASVWF